MASPSSVITRGFGTPGSARLVVTRGYGISTAVAPTVWKTQAASGRATGTQVVTGRPPNP